MNGLNIILANQRHIEETRPKQALPGMVDSLRSILTEPMPCDDCEDYATCRECECACEAYYLYEHQRQQVWYERRRKGLKWDWREGERVPSHAWMRECFKAD